MSERSREAGTTSTRRSWLLPLLSVVCSGLSFVTFGAYQSLHVKLIRPLQPNEMAWLVTMAKDASTFLALGALVLAVVTVIKGRRWQRIAGVVAMLPALAVCAVSQITF
jgi:hypothetical protein